ncbi:MAG: hypothetical protein WC521_00415 [Bdellovibrionales bacterium]
MTTVVKKHEFLLPFARIYTRKLDDAFDSIPFQSSAFFGDEGVPALTSPMTWSPEAVSVMAEAAHSGVPADLRANEENTVPSWLWSHKNNSSRYETEADLRDIFNRAVGSATAKAWKLGLFTSEKHARAFHDEARHAFMQRHIAVLPEVIASWGLSWAYGIDEEQKHPFVDKKKEFSTSVSNAAIDALVGKTKNAAAPALWKKLFSLREKGVSTVSLRFSDIAADWHSSSENPAQAAIDLLALRHDDGRINIHALRQAARLLTILLDLHSRPDVTVGIANLSPLLMASGLAYDSDAGRAMAASLIALVTAECTATSAEMASLRGMSDDFVSNREFVMRSLRNHRRAVYGDGNDYEKLSVLPAPLPLKNCPDLSLAAEAQRRWDEALELARAFGLRTAQTTDLTPSPALAVLMESASQGLEPMAQLTSLKPDDSGAPRCVLNPVVDEAFARMNYPRAVVSAATQNIVGACSLRKAPRVNASTLKAHGLNDVALEKIESYLPCVNSIRLAVTPWIIGVDFCRSQLKIPAHDLESPRFDLLRRLGFTDAEVDEANTYCYGYGTARNAKSLPLRHRPLFACGDEISAEARLRMAAAVQSFVSCDAGFKVTLSTSQSVERGADMALSVWRSGVKSMTVVFDSSLKSKPVAKSAVRRIKATAQPMAKPVVSPQRQSVRKHAPVLSARRSPAVRRGAR